MGSAQSLADTLMRSGVFHAEFDVVHAAAASQGDRGDVSVHEMLPVNRLILSENVHSLRHAGGVNACDRDTFGLHLFYGK